ncbi:hypothetical protein KPL78_18545 [Roseomonas sp. HJA6]|uniref:Uncharacterized protein n=1 Tax=Roseomonas alba TaxID=2846776 RepID=A0ABS7AC38_9PROT|nr:hypothetical protein [Neoroseomonas alba]MBW6399865.1 hypothetical protein [Neoroseomonas alba]
MTYKANRKRRPHVQRGGDGQRKAKPSAASTAQQTDKDAEIARLTLDLADARSKLQEIEEKGTDAYSARKIESLLEAAQIARGQAFDASVARNRAEGELRIVRRAILEARGPSGWLLRRAARRVLAAAAASPGD